MYFNGESPVYSCFVQTPIAQFFQSFLWFGGSHYRLTAHVLQGIWLLVVALCAAPLFCRRQPYAAPPLAAARVGVFGLMLFIALFEGRSRYLTNFLPVFVLLATFGASLLCDAAGAGRRARPSSCAEELTQ